MGKRIKEVTKNTETGVYSGRGIGIPVAGAIGVDRSSHLGDPPRPYFIGNAGSPNSSADVNHSRRLGVVNRGYEKDVENLFTLMFPDQADEENIGDEENIYYMYDDQPLRTRKLSIPSLILRPGTQYIKNLSSLEESHMSRSKYSIKPLFDECRSDVLNEFRGPNISFTAAGEFIEDLIELPADAIEEFLGPVADLMKPMWSTITDISGDIIAGILAIPPVIGDAIALSFAAYNIEQLKTTMAKADNAIYEFERSPSDRLRNKMASLLDDLARDLTDLMQRLLEAVPDPGVTEATSMMFSLMQNAKRLRGHLSKIGFRYAGKHVSFGTRVKEKAQMTLVIKPALRILTGLLASDYSPPVLSENSHSISRIPEVMAKLFDLITIWDAHGEIAGMIEDREGLLSQELESERDVMEDEMLSAMETQPLPTHLAESVNLRAFVREIILSEYAHRYTVNLHGPSPTGYLSYEPKEVGEQPEEFSDDNIADFNLNAVLYPSDGGYNAYSPKTLSESDVTSTLRDLVREIMFEKLEGDDDDSDDDLDEESTTANVAGYVEPLSSGSKKNIRTG